MIIPLLIVSQIGSVYISYLITKKSFSYLVLSNLILFLCLVGSILNEIEIYGSHEASLYVFCFGVLLNLGAWFQNLFLNKKLGKARAYSVGAETGLRFVNELNTGLVISVLLFFFAIALLFFARYGIPLFYDDLKYSRRDIQEDTHIYYRFFLHFIPISSAFLYARYKIYKKRSDKKLFIISFVVSSVILLALGFKGFVLWYVIFIIMLLNVYSDNVFRYAVVLGAVGLVSGLVATILMYSFTVSESLELLLGRATQIAAYGYNMVFYELYPQLQYVSIGNSSLNQFLAEWKFGVTDNMAVHSMGITTTIVGALLVYLGKVGALLSALAIGFVMQYIYFLALKYKVSPLFGVFYLYLTSAFVGVVPRGTLQSVFTQPVLSLILLVVFYLVLEVLLKGNGKYKFNRVRF